MLVTHTRTPLSGDRISVHQVTSNLTEATRNEHVTTQPKVVTRNITTKTGPKNQGRGGREEKAEQPDRSAVSYEVSVGCSTAHPSRMSGLSPISTLSRHGRDTRETLSDNNQVP